MMSSSRAKHFTIDSLISSPPQELPLPLIKKPHNNDYIEHNNNNYYNENHLMTSSLPLPLSPLNCTVTTPYLIQFQRGALIQLANGSIKPVEQMEARDFYHSASCSPNLIVDSSIISCIRDKDDNKEVSITFTTGKNQIRYTVDVPLEHPFFVENKGWSSYFPSKTLHIFGLNCRKLEEGDRCIALTDRFTAQDNH